MIPAEGASFLFVIARYASLFLVWGDYLQKARREKESPGSLVFSHLKFSFPCPFSLLLAVSLPIVLLATYHNKSKRV